MKIISFVFLRFACKLIKCLWGEGVSAWYWGWTRTATRRLLHYLYNPMPHPPYPAIRVVMGRRTEEIKKKTYRSPALVVMIDRCVCWLMIEWLQPEKETISRQPEKSQQQKNWSTNTSAIIRIHSPTDQNNKPRNTHQARLRQQQQKPTNQTKNNNKKQRAPFHEVGWARYLHYRTYTHLWREQCTR